MRGSREAAGSHRSKKQSAAGAGSGRRRVGARTRRRVGWWEQGRKVRERGRGRGLGFHWDLMDDIILHESKT